MAGHSKWHNIQKRKGAADASRGKVFSQISKQIRITTRDGKSGDPAANPALRLALEKARAANMPKDNIQRAIDRGLGKGKGGAIQEIVYEAFGPGGAGLIIVTQSDNPQRTAAEMRFILSRGGGSMGSPHSVMYMFARQGDEYTPTIPLELTDEAQIEKVLELMNKIRENEDVEDVFTAAVWVGKDEEENE